MVAQRRRKELTLFYRIDRSERRPNGYGWLWRRTDASGDIVLDHTPRRSRTLRAAVRAIRRQVRREGLSDIVTIRMPA